MTLMGHIFFLCLIFSFTLRIFIPVSHLQGWTCPSPDSVREDLAYCEHLPDSQEDITWRGRGREGLAPQRKTTNPLDLAVMRLAALEQNVERRYLREPLCLLMRLC